MHRQQSDVLFTQQAQFQICEITLWTHDLNLPVHLVQPCPHHTRRERYCKTVFVTNFSHVFRCAEFKWQSVNVFCFRDKFVYMLWQLCFHFSFSFKYNLIWNQRYRWFVSRQTLTIMLNHYKSDNNICIKFWTLVSFECLCVTDAVWCICTYICIICWLFTFIYILW